MGGPIIKDKFFYFVNYDGQRRSFPIIYTGPSTSNASSAVANLLGNNCGTNTALNPVTVRRVADQPSRALLPLNARPP